MDLTPQQEAESRRIYDDLKAAADTDLLALARLLASKPDSQIFGPTESRRPGRFGRFGRGCLRGLLSDLG